MLIAIILGIALISVLWALWSLREIIHAKDINAVKKELSSGRVVFHKDAYSSSDTSSSAGSVESAFLDKR